MTDQQPAKEIHLLSWKTAANTDQRTVLDGEVDMQGISETWAHEADLGQDIYAVKMIYLVKGYRKKEPNGKRIQQSCLTVGYKQLQGEWAYSPKYVSPKWEKFFVWQEMGSKEWVDMLMEGRHHPTKDGLGMELGKLVMEPALYYRKPDKITRWQMQTSLGEESWTRRIRGPKDDNGHPVVIEDGTRSCVWPSRCGFYGYCHESLDIEDGEKFVVRRPHHGPEAGAQLPIVEVDSDLMVKLQELIQYAAGREIIWVDRSRVLTRHRCELARWLEYHYGGLGVRPKATAIPLATGIVVHEGLGALMVGKGEDEAVGLALEAYQKIIRDGGIREDEFTEDGQPITDIADFHTELEQMCLAEGLVRLANRVVIGNDGGLLDKYRTLAVEKEVIRILWEDESRVWVWQARADAVLEKKGGLEMRSGAGYAVDKYQRQLEQSVAGILGDMGGGRGEEDAKANPIPIPTE